MSHKHLIDGIEYIIFLLVTTAVLLGAVGAVILGLTWIFEHLPAIVQLILVSIPVAGIGTFLLFLLGYGLYDCWRKDREEDKR